LTGEIGKFDAGLKMTKYELIYRYPILYHMSEAGSWESIRKHGLLSTTALLDLFEVSNPKRDPIESHIRHENIDIEHPVHGKAVIRDQLKLCDDPLRGVFLKDCLVSTTVSEWLKFLNGKTFFWVDTKRLTWMLKAPQYQDRGHWVITVDTRDLLDRYGSRVALSGLNSGSILNGKPRGPHTFKTISNYQLTWVAELAVEYSVPDIVELALSVDEWKRDKKLGVIWKR